MLKKTKSFRMSAMFIAAVMLLNVFTLFTCGEVAAADPDDNILSDKMVTISAFDQESVATQTPYAFTEGSPIGMRLNFGAPFKRVSVTMPTWGDTVSLTISLYKWNTDFDTTRKEAPIETKKLRNIETEALLF